MDNPFQELRLITPSLREWLTRKQKETRRGRAELLLADRAGVWNARPENRQLPSLLQWLQIRRLTAKKNWTSPQRKMMRKAGRYHAMRGMALGLLLVATAVACLTIRDRVEERRNATPAEGFVQAVLNADTTQVPAIIDAMAEYRQWTDPLLCHEYDNAVEKSPQKLHASLALLPVDPGQVDYLYGRLLDPEPSEVPMIRDALAPHKDALLERLWAVAVKSENDKKRLRAAAALAQYDPESERWSQVREAVANDLVKVPAVYLAPWMESFRPMRSKLIAPLSEVYRNPGRGDVERSLATDILADYAADRDQDLANLLMDADEKQFVAIFAKFKDRGEQGSPFLTPKSTRNSRPRCLHQTSTGKRWRRGRRMPPWTRGIRDGLARIGEGPVRFRVSAQATDRPVVCDCRQIGDLQLFHPSFRPHGAGCPEGFG